MKASLFILIILGTIFQNVAMFRTGGEGGYWGPLARDGVWHEALVAQLKLNVPPENPGFSGLRLTNYHYFYDLLVSKVNQITSISTRFLIYRFFPVTFSVLLGVGTYMLSLRLFKKEGVSLLSVFFAYFGSSFGWVVSLFKHEPLGGESAFWANQPVSMNLNPPFAASLVLIIFFLIVLDSYLKKRSFVKALFLVFVSGILAGFKAYAGIIVSASLVFLTLKKILVDKDLSLLPVCVASLLVSFATYFVLGRGSEKLILLQPFWLIHTMIDAGDRVGIQDLSAKRFAYLAGKKWLPFALLETLTFLIFVVGNLGTRIIAVAGFKEKISKNDLSLFVLFAAVVSFIPPLIFVQKGNPWNIVQFLYYFLYFFSLWAARSLVNFPKGIIVLVLLVTPLSSFATFRSWLYPNPVAYLPANEKSALEFLAGQERGIILKHPFDPELRNRYKDPYPLLVYADNAYVAAYSGKPVFIEDVEQQIILDNDYKNRLNEVNRFFVNKDLLWSKKFLAENKISYIYLPKIYQLPAAEQEFPMKKIFENEGVNIYRVVQ